MLTFRSEHEDLNWTFYSIRGVDNSTTQECCVQSWTSPGSNTPQYTNCTATCPLSRKLFKLGEPDMQDIAGEAEMNSWEMYSYGSPHMAAQKQDDQHERTFSSYVRIQVVVLKTCLGRWTIGRSGERGSGISVLPARYDDDDDDDDECTKWLKRIFPSLTQKYIPLCGSMSWDQSGQKLNDFIKVNGMETQTTSIL